MSVSVIFGSRLVMAPNSMPASSSLRRATPRVGNDGGGLVIECSSRPQKKATAHHMKTRPRKTQPWDIKRKPTVYPPLPPLPPDWTLVSSASGNASEPSSVALPPPPPEAASAE